MVAVVEAVLLALTVLVQLIPWVSPEVFMVVAVAVAHLTARVLLMALEQVAQSVLSGPVTLEPSQAQT